MNKIDYLFKDIIRSTFIRIKDDKEILNKIKCEYKILSHLIPNKLSDEVNTHFNDGWISHGFLIYAGCHFYQAIIKYE